jgi:hypothetical protein
MRHYDLLMDKITIKLGRHKVAQVVSLSTQLSAGSDLFLLPVDDCRANRKTGFGDLIIFPSLIGSRISCPGTFSLLPIIS